MYFAYILKSKTARKTYTGYTQDIEKRLKIHNSGQVAFTRRYKPWVVIHSEAHRTKEEAIKREKYLKSAAGRRWIKKNIF